MAASNSKRRSARSATRAADQAMATLLRRFRRQTPVRAGSLIITIFGDAIAPRGGTIALGSLIRLAQPFGLTERLVRTSVTRLAQDGWLRSRRDGRISFYSLTAGGKLRFAQATLRIYGKGPRTWSGRWTLILLPAAMRAAREKIREELNWLGYGQATPGAFAHPGRAVNETRDRLRELGVLDQVILLEASTLGSAADRQFARQGWDLSELSGRYQRFVEMFEPVRSSLKGSRIIAPETAFAIRTLLIHEYRKIHLRDPLLPASLLPDDWVGTSAYELCRALYARVFAAAEDYLTHVTETAAGSLPSPTRAVYRRFGGL